MKEHADTIAPDPAQPKRTLAMCPKPSTDTERPGPPPPKSQPNPAPAPDLGEPARYLRRLWHLARSANTSNAQLREAILDASLHHSDTIAAARAPGLELREFRIKHGKSLRETAAFWGITPVELGEYERGKRAVDPSGKDGSDGDNS